MSAESIHRAESLEPTTLEKEYGELVQVPVHAWDDNSPSYISGTCVWKAIKKHSLAIFHKTTYDTFVYESAWHDGIRGVAVQGQILVAGSVPIIVPLEDGSYEWMLPLEGGGAVIWKWMTPARPCDLGINPDIIVSEIGRTGARPSRRHSSFVNHNFVNHKFVGRVVDPDLSLIHI